MTTDHTDGKHEALRDIKRAKSNIESLLLRRNLPDKEKLSWAVTLLGTVLDYLQEKHKDTA